MQTVTWSPKGSDRRLAGVELPKGRTKPLTRAEWIDLLGDRVQAIVDADPDAKGTVGATLVAAGVLSKLDLPISPKEWGPLLVELLATWVLEENETWPASPPFKTNLRPLTKPHEESLDDWISRVMSKLPRET